MRISATRVAIVLGLVAVAGCADDNRHGRGDGSDALGAAADAGYPWFPDSTPPQLDAAITVPSLDAGGDDDVGSGGTDGNGDAAPRLKVSWSLRGKAARSCSMRP